MKNIVLEEKIRKKKLIKKLNEEIIQKNITLLENRSANEETLKKHLELINKIVKELTLNKFIPLIRGLEKNPINIELWRELKNKCIAYVET